MPDFIYDHKLYYNPVDFALHFIGGTWKMPILWRLNRATLRYNELKKTMPRITDKMLSSQLKELEKYDFLIRKAYRGGPTKVEYSLSSKGKKVIPVIEVIRKFGLEQMKENGIGKAG